MESVQVLDLPSRNIQYTLIDGIWDAVIDEFGQHETVLAFVEHLEGVGGEGQAATNIGIAGKHGIDVTGKFRALILVDGVRDVSIRTLNVNLAADAALGGMSACPLCYDSGGGERGGAG